MGSDWQHVVMSFDLGKESFARIQLPEVDLDDWALSIGDDRHYWITEIDGMVDLRWNQKYIIHLLSPFARGLHFVHGG
ncbi:unnamed protein product [Urochloa humidicola]